MKRFALAIAAVMLFTACKKEDHGDTNLHITGNIKGLTQGKLYIQKIEDTSLVAIDTIVINGREGFESHLKIDSPQMLYLFLDRGQTNSIDNSLPFFAEPGNMTIESHNEEFFKRAKITGSKNQKIYEDYLKIKSRFVNDNLDLIKESHEASMSGNVKKLDSLLNKEKKLEDRKYLFTLNFAVRNARHEVAPYLVLSEIPNINLVYLDTLEKSMPPKIANSRYGKMLAELIAERKKTESAR